jgi:hypothetical protein
MKYASASTSKVIVSLRSNVTDSYEGIAKDYGLDDRGSQFPAVARFFSFPQRPDWLLGLTQPHIQWTPGALFLGVKRPGHEGDHSPPSSAEVNGGTIPPLLHTTLRRSS